MKIPDFFSKYNNFIIFGTIAIAVLFFIDKPLAVSAIFVFFLTAISLFVINKCKEEKQRRILGSLFLIVFAIHILGALFFYYTKFQPFSDGYGDYFIYQQQAEQIAQRLHQGNFSLQDLSIDGISVSHSYPVIVGYIYALTMPNMLLGQLFNAWLVALLILFIYLIVREIGGSQKEAFLTALMACLYPSLAFFGSLLLKEALVILLALIALFLVLKIIKKFLVLNFLLLYATLIALTNLRFYVSYAIVIAFIIGWMIISSLAVKKRIIYAIIMLLLFGFLPQISCGYGYFGTTILKQYLSIHYITFYREVAYVPIQPKQNIQPKEIVLPKGNIEPDNNIQPDDTDKTSSVMIKAGFDNPVTFVKNSTLSFLYALFGPLPWKFNKLSQFFALPELLASYFLVYFAVRATILSIRNKNYIIIPLIIFSGIGIGILAVYMNNFGLVTRLRMPAFLILLCLLPAGFKKLKDINIPLLKKIYE